jgi:hypothetical protein
VSGWGEFVLHRGIEIVHVTGTRIVIGRSDSCEVTCEHSGVSRRHCELTAGPDGVMLKDMGSTHGTWVDGRRVKTAQLCAGSVITLGPKGARFLIVEAKYMGRSVLAPPESGASTPITAAPRSPEATVPVSAEDAKTEEIVVGRGPGFGRGLLWGMLGGALLGFTALFVADFGPLLARAREAAERLI